MGAALIERDIIVPDSTGTKVVNWTEIERLGINNPAPEMTGWKARQKYIGQRRLLIGVIDGLMSNLKNQDEFNPAAEPYAALLTQRRKLSGAQSFDRLRLAGKR